MSYQVLARKYRPKSFDTLVGQEHVVRALSHALDQQRLHHAYLFTGTRGVGKTTLSRILAKSFNCEKGITAQPCGVCDACSSIDAGRFVDYIEMDAASNRGVDEMASLLEQAIYAPSNARFKVYMIDEVHMLTNHAFNSMLKTLEEPPEHVKFILATTDPQKIPVTVLSRCLQFNLKQMPPGHIVGHLENILGQERIDFEVPALRLLAQGAHGSMRDALSLTDQAIAYAAGKVSLEAVQSMLGALDQSYLIRLLDALAEKDGASLLAVADEMASRSLSYKAALQDLGSMLHQIAVAQMVPAALAEDLPERAELVRLAQSFNREEIQLFYQIAVHGRNEIGLAPDEYAGFSMSLLRMLAFRPASIAPGASSSGGDGSNRHVSAPVSRPVPSSIPPATSLSSVAAPQAVERQPIPVTTPTPKQEVAAPKEPLLPSAAEGLPPSSAKPMSPAMAALAAARAASAKKPGSVQSTSQTVTNTPAQEIKPVIAPALVDAPPTVPRISEDKLIARGKVEAEFPSVEGQSLESGLSEMPPPWDDFDFASEQAQVGGRRFKEIQEGDYWTEDKSESASLDLAPVETNITPNTSLSSNVASISTVSESPAPIQNDSGLKNATIDAAVEVMETPSSVVKALELMPLTEIDWDGHWPNLAASLSVRGVAQQLAQQSELRGCALNGNAIQFKLCVPLQTLLSAGSGEKLTAALNERFAEFGREIRIDFEIGAVEQTANAQALAERAERQLRAEQTIQSDGFVQTLIREFGASILTGSVRPI